MRPLLQDLTNSQKEHYRAGRINISTEHGYPDRRCIQHRYFNLSFAKRAKTVPQIADRFDYRNSFPDRQWHQKSCSVMKHHLIYQLILIFPVHLSSGILKIIFRNIYVFIGKVLYYIKDSIPASMIANSCIAGSLLNPGSFYIFLYLQIVLQDICLLQSHSFLDEMNTDSAFDLMFYYKSHRNHSIPKQIIPALRFPLHPLLYLFLQRLRLPPALHPVLHVLR